MTELSRAFALCAASDEATTIRDDVSFFQALQAALNKQSSTNRKTPEQIDAAIRQLVSKAITTEGQVIDVFTAAGLPKPDISILPSKPSVQHVGFECFVRRSLARSGPVGFGAISPQRGPRIRNLQFL